MTFRSRIPIFELIHAALFALLLLLPATVQATEPLVISNAEAGNITNATALVSWQTNRPATSVATYAQSPCPCPQGISDPPDRLVTLHHISLSGLTADRDYWIQPSSIDADGNRSDGPVIQIRTLTSTSLPSIEVSAVEVSGVASAVATVRWRTYVNVIEGSGVEYGTSPCPCPNNVQVDLGTGIEHRVEVAPLDPNTTYFVRPFSYHPKDTGTITYGPNKTFTTLMGTVPTSSTASVLVTYPNGGQRWKQGERHIVSWRSTPGFVTAVRLSLLNEKQERTVLLASQSTENRPTGNAAALIPSTLPYGVYTLEIANAANLDERDTSDATVTIGDPPAPTPPPATPTNPKQEPITFSPAEPKAQPTTPAPAPPLTTPASKPTAPTPSPAPTKKPAAVKPKAAPKKTAAKKKPAAKKAPTKKKIKAKPKLKQKPMPKKAPVKK